MQDVYRQLFCLLIFTITGIIIGILFDIFRILRRSFKTADWITYLEDILFWILSGSIMLFSIFVFNNGEIRSYIFIGIAIGVIIYMLTISRYFIKSSVTIIQFIKKILSYPIKLLKNIIKIIIVKPFLFLKKKIVKIFNVLDKKIQKKTKSINKNIKNKKKTKEKEGILQKM